MQCLRGRLRDEDEMNALSDHEIESGPVTSSWSNTAVEDMVKEFIHTTDYLEIVGYCTG